MPLLADETLRRFMQLYTYDTSPGKEHAHITHYTNMRNSWEHDLFSLHIEYKTAGQPSAEEIILKIYHGNGAPQKAQKELSGMQQLLQNTFPVPHVKMVALNNSPFGHPCIAMDKIQGHTMLQAFDQASSAAQHDLLTRFCELYVHLHTLDWKPFASEPARYQTNRFIQNWLLESYMFIEQLQPLTFSPVMDWLQENSKHVVCQGFSVIHGDFHPTNVLLTDDGAAFVIDWTNIDVSDYRFDLAWTLMLISTQRDATLGNAVLLLYEQLANKPVEHIEFFMVIACIRRLFDIVVSLSSGTTRLGMQPDTRKPLHKEHIQAVYDQLQKLTGRSLPQIEKLIHTLSQTSP
jgi:aminoglycoside phosphotransferase (APT) family kinase protein